MNADDCNGRSYAQGNGGESSAEQDFYGALLQGPPARSPNSQRSSPHHSLSSNSIKVEPCSDDGSPDAQRPENREVVRDDGGERAEESEYTGAGRDSSSSSGFYNAMSSPNAASSPGPIRLPNGKLQCEVCGMVCIGPNVLMVHKRSHTGERPFQCNQCGASFTQKGNLLRHIKLHSGEKPFKCPMCNYACRRRDALAGHLRTHSTSCPTVGKPFKCINCSRSYKQQSTLEEHLERCHSYLKSLDTAVNVQTIQGEESVNMETVAKPGIQSSNEKTQFVDRLAISITKRKRSTPQKFLGEKHMHLDLPEAPYELSSGSEKDGDLMSSQLAAVDIAVDIAGSHLQGDTGKTENLNPPALASPLHHPAFLSDLRAAMGSIGSKVTPQGPRVHQSSLQSHTASPNGCPDSTDTESTTAEEQQSTTRVTAPTSTSNNNNNNNHHHHLLAHYQTRALPHKHPTSSPGQAKDMDPRGWERPRSAVKRSPPGSLLYSSTSTSSSRDTSDVHVSDREGLVVRSFHCRHCRILFLDHVMYTIHMGCHGFRQPFECNICGHRSRDRYEFSSHISRGEHQVG